MRKLVSFLRNFLPFLLNSRGTPFLTKYDCRRFAVDQLNTCQYIASFLLCVRTMKTPPQEQTRKRIRSPISQSTNSPPEGISGAPTPGAPTPGAPTPGTPYRWESSTPTSSHVIDRMKSMLANQIETNHKTQADNKTFRIPTYNDDLSFKVRKKKSSGGTGKCTGNKCTGKCTRSTRKCTRGGGTKRKSTANTNKSNKKRSTMAFMEPEPIVDVNDSELLGFTDTPTSIYSTIDDAGMESFPVSPIDPDQTNINPFSPTQGVATSAPSVSAPSVIAPSVSAPSVSVSVPSVPVSAPSVSAYANNGFGQYHKVHIPRSLYEMEKHVHVRPIHFLSPSWSTEVKKVYAKFIDRTNNRIMALAFTLALQILTFVPHTTLYPNQNVNKSDWETFVLFTSVKIAVKFETNTYVVEMIPEERRLEEHVLLNTKINPMNPTVYTFVEMLMPSDTPDIRKHIILYAATILSAMDKLYLGDGKPSHIAKAILNNMANTNYPVESTLQSKVIALSAKW